MPTVELGDICEFLDHKRKPVSEELRTPGPFPYYGANGQQGWINDYIFDETLVLLAEDGGHFGSKTNPIAYKISGKTWVNNHAHVLRPLDGCDVDYLTHVLSFCDVTKIISGTTRLKLTKGNAELIRIPLPDLSEQRQIAGRLEQADRLIRTRRYALELTDTFLPAAFLELFGDPNSNPEKWPTCRLADVLLSAQDGPHVSPKYCAQGVPFLSTRNVRPGELVWDDLKYISAADARAQWRKVKPEIGDILYTKGGTTGMAKAVDFEKEVAVWVHIAVLKLRKDAVVSVWLENMLNSRFCYQQSQELTFGIVNRDLGLKRMPHIRMYLPPFPLQQKFAALVERVDRLRAVQREALRQAEHLFACLLYRAFSG